MTLREYHDRTKHSVRSVREGAHALDWDNQPLPFKVYPDLPAVALPTELPGSQRLALDALAGRAPQDRGGVDVAALAHLLYFSAGVLRRRTYPGGEIHYRAAACTGALYHIDLYVVSGQVAGLDAGVHHFGAHDFALRRLRDGDHRAVLVAACGGHEAIAASPLLLVATSTFWRNAWKYRARAYRHTFWDAGTLLANLLAVAAGLGIPARIVAGFDDIAVARLLDVDPDREAPVVVVALGTDGAPVPPAPEPAPLGLATLPLAREEIVYPLIAAARDASSLASGDAARRWRAGDTPVASASTGYPMSLEPLPARAVPEPIEAVILRRGSTRRFPRAPIPLAGLATILAAAAAPVPLDVRAPPRCYLLAHAVDGLPSGAYAVRPDGRGLEQLRLGDFRADAGHLGLGQDLPADAAAALYWLVDLDGVFARLGDRGYRVAQLEGGIAGGRAYLAAYALGLGATGLTFFDDDVTAFFSPHAAGLSVMFHVAIGRRGRARRPPP
jgi:SagB-type dehydrogenase family enzyme